MDELVSAAATIHGAQIQANFALWGAILAASIGGVALIISIRYTANFTLKAHKADKLAELKSKTYFDCIAIYAEFSSSAFNIVYKVQSTNEEILSNQRDFMFALNKASFVSNENTQLKIGRFINFFNEWLREFYVYLNLTRKSDSELYSMVASNKLKLENFDANKIKSNAIISARNKITLLDEEYRKLENAFRVDLGIEESTSINEILKKETQELSKKHSELLREILAESIDK